MIGTGQLLLHLDSEDVEVQTDTGTSPNQADMPSYILDFLAEKRKHNLCPQNVQWTILTLLYESKWESDLNS